MNKEWSELNKAMQNQLKKRETCQAGVAALFDLRNRLMDTMLSFREALSPEDFSAFPFINADGCHSSTIAFSLWHIFRIEDIVAHTLIEGDEQVFFRGDYQRRINAPIVTTGNELVKQQVAVFSKQLDIQELYAYILEVKRSTEEIVRKLSFDDLKRRMTDDDRERLKALCVVSDHEDAAWLIDYWCGKDVRGLIQMPFSRHWIMHVEGCMKIRDRVRR